VPTVTAPCFASDRKASNGRRQPWPWSSTDAVSEYAAERRVSFEKCKLFNVQSDFD